MIQKTELRKKAIKLRKNGMTYGGIMDRVPVAKSTLALWFKDVKLSKPQKQRITKARLEAGLRGGLAKKNQRIKKMSQIISAAEKQIGRISKRELWLIGTALYWAEGSKEKEWNPGSGAEFMNMDGEMIKAFLRWLDLCKVKRSDICLEIYIHENHKAKLSEVKSHWSKITGLPLSSFNRIYFKKHNLRSKRRNNNENYYGILKIVIKQSSTFVRQITGWIKGISNGINNK